MSELRPSRLFLSGPIPWPWLCVASALPGAAVAVGVALWLEVGLSGERRVRLSMLRLRELGVTRWSAYRALRALEGATLVCVERHAGRLARVIVLDHRPEVLGAAKTSGAGRAA